MSAKAGFISLLLSIVALCLSAVTFFSNNKTSRTVQPEAGETQYVMYVGTNDKDNNEPVFTPEQAQERLDSILTKHFEGFTIQEARGGWINEDGSVAHEYTLVVYLSDTTLDKVHAAADDLISEFHQSTVLIQQNKTETEFYSGNT